MANPKFLGCDLSIPTYAWKKSTGVDNSNASYPVSNLKNYFPDIVSKSNDTSGDQYFLIDFGTAVSCNAIVLDGCSFNAGIAVLLQVNTNDDTTWTDAVDVVQVDVVATQIKTFAAVSKRYWRLLFTDSVSALEQIGNIFLGTTLDFASTEQWGGVPQMPSHNTAQSEALDGRLRSATTAGGRYNWEIEFKLVSNAIVSVWRNFLLTVKNNGIPFYYIDNAGAVWCVVFEANYNPARTVVYNLNDIVGFKLKTVLANY